MEDRGLDCDKADREREQGTKSSGADLSKGDRSPWRGDVPTATHAVDEDGPTMNRCRTSNEDVADDAFDAPQSEAGTNVSRLPPTVQQSVGDAIVLPRRRLRRLGEDDETFLAGSANRAAEHDSCFLRDRVSQPGAAASNPERQRQSRNGASLSRADSSAEAADDESFTRLIDAELEALSVSVAKLRRIAEAMGREIEAQSRALAGMRAEVADDQQAVGKAAVVAAIAAAADRPVGAVRTRSEVNAL
ncbi:uncharacterized protein PV09_07970 [Verruconis gallopava]|uniref:t-SNARE coiled-coil homology domain-containing protein n=1 Tax=Verruconis gallopava TaxID=253628 RepID=A0A0D1YHW1_9PEZI|nr:uncharacterized protein PV09_07970 [Verruconis gallopava]KIW00442.1 hypothetical protein PV09_07970 [Verruconis gallopava]